MYEILIKGGKVIDPAQRIDDFIDVATSGGKIAALARGIAPGEAKKVIDAKGMIVSPGIIDFHCHVADGIIPNGAPPDHGGVFSGITTLGDGGSTGYANFGGFRRYVISQSRTDIFCFLHMCSTGIAYMPEIWSWQNINTEAVLKTIEGNRDIIKGVKLRAIGSVVQGLGVEAVKVAKRVAVEAGLPLMVHIGPDLNEIVTDDIMSAFVRKMLPLLDKGDILSHIYTWKAGSVIKPDGSVIPELKDAMERGVALDTAIGKSQWSYDIARKGIDQGILPTTLSTDLSINTINGPVFNLLATMSKFIAAGLKLEQVIEMTTINPARILREEARRGKLGIGMPADVSILEPREGDFLFTDGHVGRAFKGKLLLLPKLTLKNGEEIAPSPIASGLDSAFKA